jgi:hypothetical protein
MRLPSTISTISSKIRCRAAEPQKRAAWQNARFGGMNLATAIVCRKGRTRQRLSLGDFVQRSEGIGSRSGINSGRFFGFALIASALATLLSVNSTPSQAQAWPTRQPIRVIVPLTAGSAIDIVGRLVFGQISNQIGQTVVIENRAGASQTIGAAAVAKADPDGYTILVAGSALAVVPSTMANPPLNVQADLTAVGAPGERSTRARRAAGQKISGDPRVRSRRESQTRRDDVRIGRARRCDPSGCGAVSARRRIGGPLRAVQRRLRGVDRSDGGTARLLHGSDISSHAATRGQTASGVGGRKRDPRLGTT